MPKSPMHIYYGVLSAISAIKEGNISENDRKAILEQIQKHDSRADESDVDDVLRRISKLRK